MATAVKRQAKIPKYDTSLPERIVALGGNGFCLEQIKFELNLKQNAVLEYSKLYPEFKAALSEADKLAHEVVATRRKRPVGRPTLYTPEMCDVVISLGMGDPEDSYRGGGHSHAQMARHIGVAVDTLYEWRDKHVEFSGALSRATNLSEAWWEDKAHSGIDVQGFNGGLWKVVMSARFPKTYREPAKIELTGKDGAPLPTSNTVVTPVITDEVIKSAVDKFKKFAG